MANVGTIDSTAVAAVGISSRDATGKIPGQGAKGRGEAEYRGEVFLTSGVGSAEVVDWSPNRVAVRVTGGVAGDRLVLNQNFDAGWRANGQPAQNYRDTISVPVAGGSEEIVFAYRPRLWYWGLAVFAATLAAIGYLLFREQKPARASALFAPSRP